MVAIARGKFHRHGEFVPPPEPTRPPQRSAVQTFPIMIPRFIVTQVRLSWRGMMAYAVLSYLAGDQSLEIGLKQAGELFSISEMSLHRGIRELVQKKVVKVERRKSKKLGNLPNVYTLLEVSDVPI